jgi:hypothetical protein
MTKERQEIIDNAVAELGTVNAYLDCCKIMKTGSIVFEKDERTTVKFLEKYILKDALMVYSARLENDLEELGYKR